jgi:proliferating cell nuclear antigen
MTNIFLASTDEAYKIKVLIEMLCNTIKLACFEISSRGIFLKTTDNEDKLLIDISLHRASFKKFICRKTMYIGLNVIHLHKMIKSIKKKESITMYISEDRPSDLAISIIQSDCNHKNTSYVKIQSVQNVDINIPSGYKYPIIIPSSNFQKLVKSINNAYDKVEITSIYGWIRFLCDAGEVYSREIEFGEFDITPEMEKDNGVTLESILSIDKQIRKTGVVPEDWYHCSFYTYQLFQLIKMTGLSTNIKFYITPGFPLMISINVGSLGTLTVYIKSIEQVNDREDKNQEEKININDFELSSDDEYG